MIVVVTVAAVVAEAFVVAGILSHGQRAKNIIWSVTTWRLLVTVCWLHAGPTTSSGRVTSTSTCGRGL